MLSLARRAQGPEHIFNEKLLSTSYKEHRQLKSRHSFVPAALELVKDFSKSDTSVACWLDTKWNTEWQSITFRLRNFIPDVNPKPLEMYLPTPS